MCTISRILVPTSDGERRYYSTPEGRTYPSVTTILSSTKDMRWLQKWRKKIGEEAADAQVAQSLERGTRFHAEIENFLKNGELGESEDFNTWLTWYQSSSLTMVDVEKFVYSDEYGYAGTIDYIGKTEDDRYVVLDWKTSRNVRPSGLRDYYIQASAYAMASGCTTGGIVVVVGEDVAYYPLDVETRFEQFLERLDQYYMGAVT